MTDDTEKKGRKTSDTARRIWLAGIGAYGRAFSEAQEAFKDMTGETSRVFDDLVQKGEVIEMTVGAKGKDFMEKAGMPSFDIPSFDMDERIAKMRSRLMRGEDVAEDITGLEARLDRVEAKLDQVIDLLAPKSKTKAKKKPAAKKKAPAKKRTTTTRKSSS
jgi:paraquat-inducible protein B